MERLTLKNKEWACQLTTPMYDKLHDLEDIEEELGIDLFTFFKAMEKDIWIKWNNKIMFVRYDDKYPVFCEGILFCTVRNVCGKDHESYCLSIDDYGKTWALTKEELL
jgi:hypothetical protein